MRYKSFRLGVINGALFEVVIATMQPGLVLSAFFFKLTDSTFYAALPMTLMYLGGLWPPLIVAHIAEGMERKKPIYIFAGATRALYGDAWFFRRSLRTGYRPRRPAHARRRRTILPVELRRAVLYRYPLPNPCRNRLCRNRRTPVKVTQACGAFRDHLHRGMSTLREDRNFRQLVATRLLMAGAMAGQVNFIPYAIK